MMGITRFIALLMVLNLPASVILGQYTKEPGSFVFDLPAAIEKANITLVRNIYFDSRRFLWIGCEGGLYRYDGCKVVAAFHTQTDSNSIPSNSIKSIAEDANGNIWLGTHGGIACMNPYNFKCRIYDQLNNRLNGNYDNRVMVDKSDEIWAGNEHGLSRLNRQLDRFEEVWGSRQNGNRNFYITCLIDDDSLVIAGGWGNLMLFNKKTGAARLIPLPEAKATIPSVPTQMLFDKAGTLWLGTWGAGLLKLNRPFEKFRELPGQINGNENRIIRSLLLTEADGHSTLWLGMANGLRYFNPEEYTTGNSGNFTDIGEKLLGKDEIIAQCLDSEGYLWVGGQTLHRLKIKHGTFRTAGKIEGEIQDLNKLVINGKLLYFVSCWQSSTGLVILDSSFTVLKRLNRSDFKSGADFPNISGVVQDKYGRLWISGLQGLYISDPTFRNIHKAGTTSGSDTVTGNKTSGVIIYHDTVWVANYKHGIDLFSLQQHKIHHFNNGDGSGLQDDLVKYFFKDSKDNLWLCGHFVLYKYCGGDKPFKQYKLSSTGSGCSPIELAEGPDGKLLVASSSGLILFDPVKETFRYLVSAGKETGTGINSIAIDRMGNPWYLSGNHVMQYELAKNKEVVYGKEDGFDEDPGSFLIRSFDHHALLIAQRGGLLCFNAGDFENRDTTGPAIFISQIKINDSVVIPGVPVRELRLRYFQNRLSFDFAGKTFVKPDQNEYAFMLKGVDKGWIISDRTTANYSNISPGEYVFSVKAANYHGDWGPEYEVAIFIAPPFWQTWWFRILALAIVVVSFSWGIKYFSQRNLRERILILEKEKAIEEERTRIAKDMHDEMGSELTKISIMSQVARSRLGSSNEAHEQLQKISVLSGELVDGLQQIIWALNPKHDSLDSLVVYIREFVAGFFEQTDIHVKFNYPVTVPQVKLTEEVRRNVFLAVKEACNNIVKHAGCSDVTIGISIAQNRVTIVLSDNGNGFNRENVRTFGNGLFNMAQRMNLINGEMDVRTAEGRGTIITLAFPV